MYGEQYKDTLLPTPPATNNQDARNEENRDDEEVEEALSIQQYLSSYDYEDDDISTIVALMFLRKFTCGFSSRLVGEIPSSDSDSDSDSDGDELTRWEAGQNPITVETEVEAKNIVAMIRPPAKKKKVLEILAGHVPYRHRKKVAHKELVSWLQQPNSIRSYMLYKNAGLKELMTAKGLCFPPETGRVNAQQMIDALAGIPGSGAVDRESLAVEEASANEDLDAKSEAIQSILNKSFLPHQKGQNREYCILGHELEIPILKSWIRMVTSGPESPQPGLQVHSAFTAGLAAKKGAVYAKDSIDFLVTVCDPSSGSYAIKVWGFEAKGRVTATTAAEEERHLRQLANPHLRITDSEVHEFVQKEAERFQTMQHAYVYNLDTVILAITDKQSELILSAIIDYSTELRMHFGNVLKDLKEISLDWVYDTLPVEGETNRRRQVVTIPQEIIDISKTVKTINGIHTLQGTVNLWMSMCSVPKPFPSFRRLLPAIYAFWNSVKGGSDTTTKLMDDCNVQVPKVHMNTETVAITRLIQFLNVLNHRVMQTFSAKSNLPYPSLKHYRKAASDRQTYHGTLMISSDAFRTYLKDLEKIASPSVATPPPELRRAPRRVRVDGALPEKTSFGGILPYKTPTKHAHLIRTGTATDDAKKMFESCTGRPMQVYPIKSDNKCFLCKTNTSWYCAGCKLWLCCTRTSKRGDSGKELELYEHTMKNHPRTFIKTCFHRAHEKAWKISDDENNKSPQEEGRETSRG